MSDREWLDKRMVVVEDTSHQINGVNQTMNVVLFKDAVEYGERCARGKSKIISSDHFDHVSTSEWKLSCGHTTVTNIGYQPNYCEWCGAEVYYD